MQTTLDINDLEMTCIKLERLGHKLIIIAGASASGKSYFAHKLAEHLRSQGKKVLEISSDDYYSNETGLKFMLYGTFDHPRMIKYDELRKNLEHYLATGSMIKPHYSFKEKRTTHYSTITEKADYIIVEGIYAITALAEHFVATTVFVHADREELIFRRIIRDQARVAEPTYMLVENLGKAFPMWKIYGEPQQRQANLIIDNSYQILEHKGRPCIYKALTKARSNLGKVVKTDYITDFVYTDDRPENGNIVISEVYASKTGLLDHLVIAKVQKQHNGEEHIIDLKLYQPGMLVQLHTLMQTAELTMLGIRERREITYAKNGRQTTVRELDGQWSVKVKGET